MWNRAAFVASVFCGLLFGLGGEGCGRDPAQDCQDDGIFCNGIERYIPGVDGAPGQCVKVPAAPCDDGADCTVDVCDEASRTCSHTAMGACAVCQQDDCTPSCRGKVCGSDGCGGSCGSCGGGQGCNPSGACANASRIGTCQNPRPLAVMLGSDQAQKIRGDTSAAIHQTVPTCNRTSLAVEDVYSFTLTAPTGIEAISQGYDTVLSLRREDPGTPGPDCLDDSAKATVACSDDTAPPGDYGSRVTALLQPGTYYLLVDGFDDSNFGPYTLKVKFVAGCVPNCDGQFCNGSDGCGGTCGSCPAGQACGTDLRCRPSPCVPKCKNDDGSPRTCGDDGCLGSCGSCASGELCVPKTGSCAPFPRCDHGKPSCSPACATGFFCGSDCACHKLSDPLPDLIVNAERLRGEILFDEITVDKNSCSVVEQCVGGLGKRRLLRFSVEAINQGQGALHMDAPDLRPDQFHSSACHGHYHYDGFAAYALLDMSGREIALGRKQAYCMEDTRQVAEGPNVPCRKRYSCSEQGIQPGWGDLYGNSLDCQWLDITEVPAGDYQLRVTLNPQRALEEVTTDNNTAIVPVQILPR